MKYIAILPLLLFLGCSTVQENLPKNKNPSIALGITKFKGAASLESVVRLSEIDWGKKTANLLVLVDCGLSGRNSTRLNEVRLVFEKYFGEIGHFGKRDYGCPMKKKSKVQKQCELNKIKDSNGKVWTLPAFLSQPDPNSNCPYEQINRIVIVNTKPIDPRLGVQENLQGLIGESGNIISLKDLLNLRERIPPIVGVFQLDSQRIVASTSSLAVDLYGLQQGESEKTIWYSELAQEEARWRGWEITEPLLKVNFDENSLEIDDLVEVQELRRVLENPGPEALKPFQKILKK